MKKNKIIAMLFALFGLVGLTTSLAVETKANTEETILLTDYLDSLGVEYNIDINWEIGDTCKEYLIFVFEFEGTEGIGFEENIKVFDYDYADKEYDEYNSVEKFDENVSGNMWYYAWDGNFKLFIYNDLEIYDINNIYYSRAGDYQRPVVDGINYSVISNVENPFSFEEIINTITAIDNTDGDITSKIIYETNYPKTKETLENLQLGKYTVNATVSDTAGNITKFSFTIYAIDINAATWSGTTTYNQSNTTKLTLEEIKSNLTCNDSFEGKIDPEIWELVRDDYSANYKKPGYYEVEYTACDSSENYSSVIIGINVKDTVKPVITGADTITKNQTVTLTLSEILENYTAKDDCDGDITSKIVVSEDGYTGNGGIAGNYSIVLSVTDKAGNIGTHTINVVVVDNIPPVYYLNQDTIIVSNTSPLTRSQMISILRQMGKIDIVATNFVTIDSAYFDTPEIPNVYAMSVKVKSSSGTEVNENMTIKVTPTDSGSIEVKPKKKKPWYVRIFSPIANFFAWIWKWIVRFFKWIF